VSVKNQFVQVFMLQSTSKTVRVGVRELLPNDTVHIFLVGINVTVNATTDKEGNTSFEVKMLVNEKADRYTLHFVCAL